MNINLLSLVSAAKDSITESFKAAKTVVITGIVKAGFVAAGSGQTAKRDGLIVKADSETLNILPGSFLCAMYKAGRTDVTVADSVNAKDSARIVSIIGSAKGTAPVQNALAEYKTANEKPVKK